MASELQNPPVLVKPFADNGDKNVIPEESTGTQQASLDEGFPAITSIPLSQGGIPPERKDFNGLGNMLSKQFFFLQNGGRFTFNPDVSNAIGGYPKGAVLQYNNVETGDFYQVRSLINNNTYNFVATPSYIDGAKWEKLEVPTNRNIGEFVYSGLPLIDANLHLLDGSVIEAGVYSAFVDYIADLYGDGTNIPEYFCSEADWQTSVSTYGVCGKFVYDSTNNTVRLPKITGFVEGTTDLTALGDLIEAGVPNIEGSVNSALNYYRDGRDLNATGAFGGTVPDSGSVDGSSSGSDCCAKSTITFDASLSNSIYGNSDTVQPQSIKVLVYMVLATAKQTDVEVNINEIVTDLNEKVSKRDLVSCAVVTESYVNGTSWYRVWSDGWCEQGGLIVQNSNFTRTINLLKSYSNTDYICIVCPGNNTYSQNGYGYIGTRNTDSFQCVISDVTSIKACWHACGYIN